MAVEQQRAATDEISKNAQLTANETQLVSSAIQEMSSETATAADLSSSVRATASEVAEQVADMQSDLMQKCAGAAADNRQDRGASAFAEEARGRNSGSAVVPLSRSRLSGISLI